MRMLRSFFIALSIYSQIPVPQFAWKEEDMKYSLCFFPLVGAIIGGFEALWYAVSQHLAVSNLCYAAIATAIPLAISGGFHVDGYMDTMDALHSYQPREKKLEILKDPHIGAFAVIMLAFYYLVDLAMFAEVRQWEGILTAGAGFLVARAFSALAVVTFPSAKADGMLVTFQSSAQKAVVLVSVLVEILVAYGTILWMQVGYGLALMGTSLLSFGYYYYKSKKEFGGITGDLAGFFVTMCELMVLTGAVLVGVLY